MNRGDIYMVTLDPVLGREQKGERPVLVISHTKFNKASNVPVILPITQGGNFARELGFSVTLMGAGTKTNGIIRCDQPRAIDLKARYGRWVEAVPDAIVNEVLSKIIVLFESD